MNLDLITPLILTFNEEANIARTLAALKWAKRIVVVDSGSTDGTLEILRADSRVAVFSRSFDSHANQWNFGLRETAIETTWVLALDADYVLTDELNSELGSLAADSNVAGYRASFIYCIDGRPLWGSLYPPVVVLYRRKRGTYEQGGHTQRLHIDGQIKELRGQILHDDRKPFSRWLAAQKKYAVLDAAKIKASAFVDLSWPDRVRKLVLIAPPLVLLYCLFWKGCVLQGRAGLTYAFQRAIAEAVLAARLLGVGRVPQ